MLSSLSVKLGSSVDSIERALVTDQLKGFLRVRYSQWITWSPDGPKHVVGKIPYLRSKNLSGVRFHVHLEEENGGSRATLSVEPTAFFLKNKGLLYAAGLLMCCVGVLFPVVGLSMLEKRLNEAQADVANALSEWDKAQTSHA